MTQFIILPGFGGSGSKHWQTIWEQGHGSWQRFSPSSWDLPQLDDWCAALECAVKQANKPPVLVAHSLACLLIAHWSARSTATVAGAFLVAVPDPSAPQFPGVEAASFAKAPEQPLRFASTVVASNNDPYGSLAYQRDRANAWGSRFVDIGACGHINADSDLGDWSAGRQLLNELLTR